MLLDTTTPAFNNVTIFGHLIVEPDRGIKGLGITANFIWIYGRFEVGSDESSFK